MVLEDATAFVERLEVSLGDKRGERLRGQIRVAQLKALESQSRVRAAVDYVRALESQADGDGSIRRELARARPRVRKAQQDFERRRARVEKLERDLLGLEERGESVVSFRFHSEEHHIDCSQERFLELRLAQKTSPRMLLKGHGRQWWWYSDRFWWDDTRLSTRELQAAVHEADLMAALRRHLTDVARVSASGSINGDGALGALPDHVRVEVWRRDDGRCVDCGSEEDLGFALVGVSETEPDAPSVDEIELLCKLCSSLRGQPGRGALAWDAAGR